MRGIFLLTFCALLITGHSLPVKVEKTKVSNSSNVSVKNKNKELPKAPVESLKSSKSQSDPQVVNLALEKSEKPTQSEEKPVKVQLYNQQIDTKESVKDKVPSQDSVVLKKEISESDPKLHHHTVDTNKPSDVKAVEKVSKKQSVADNSNKVDKSVVSKVNEGVPVVVSPVKESVNEQVVPRNEPEVVPAVKAEEPSTVKESFKSKESTSNVSPSVDAYSTVKETAVFEVKSIDSKKVVNNKQVPDKVQETLYVPVNEENVKSREEVGIESSTDPSDSSTSLPKNYVVSEKVFPKESVEKPKKQIVNEQLDKKAEQSPESTKLATYSSPNVPVNSTSVSELSPSETPVSPIIYKSDKLQKIGSKTQIKDDQVKIALSETNSETYAEDARIEQNSRDISAFLSEPIDSATKLLIDLEEQVKVYLSSEDPDPVTSTVEPQSYGAGNNIDEGADNNERQAQVQLQNLVDQVNRLAQGLESTITELVSRRRYVTAAMLRSVLNYLRRVRISLERLQNRLQALQAAASSGQTVSGGAGGGGSQTLGSPVPGSPLANVLISIRDRVNTINEEIGSLMTRIRASFVPTSTAAPKP